MVCLARRSLPILISLVLASWLEAAQPFGIVIHGGAGTVTRERVAAVGEKRYRDGLDQALAAGYAILARGGSSLDAVQAAVAALEQNPCFNAGIGATLNRDGVHELDAAIMDGRTLAAGAVAGIQHVASPVGLARLVLDKSPHVLLIGPGAEAFAQSQGVPLVANSYFRTAEAWAGYQKLKAKEAAQNAPATKDTVGAVALDQHGNLAAATSTGGMLNKLPGRVGDAPLIGSGTYADNATCAVSCTGWGEFFIRCAVAHDVSARMAYQGAGLVQAAQASLDKAFKLGGDGGLIALDRQGHLAMLFNTPGMFRAQHMGGGPVLVKLFGDE